MRSLAQEASLFGTVACWLFIAGTPTLLCYFFGAPLIIIGLVLLGIALKRISVLAQDPKIFVNYVLGCALSWVPLLGFEMKMTSLTRAGEHLGITDFSKAASWWRISYYMGLLGILLPFCVLIPLIAGAHSAHADPDMSLAAVASVVLYVILIVALLTCLGISIYSSTITLLAFKKLESQTF